MREAMTSHPPKPVTVTLLNYRKDGTPFWNALHVAPVRDADGVLEYYIGVQLDVSQQQQQAHEVAAVAENAAGRSGEHWGDTRGCHQHHGCLVVCPALAFCMVSRA
jgi:hypothetical protein